MAILIFKILFTFLLYKILLLGLDAKQQNVKPAEKDAYPYVVSVQEKDKHVCAGSLISSKHVLTASCCVRKNKVRSYLVTVEDINYLKGQRVSVKYIHDHLTSYGHFDFAIIELEKSLELSTSIGTITLGEKEPAIGEECTLLGWNMKDKTKKNVLYSSVLKVASGKIIDPKQCDTHKEASIICVKTSVFFYETGGLLICNGKLSGMYTSCEVHFIKSTLPIPFNNAIYSKDWILQNSKVTDEKKPDSKSSAYFIYNKVLLVKLTLLQLFFVTLCLI